MSEFATVGTEVGRRVKGRLAIAVRKCIKLDLEGKEPLGLFPDASPAARMIFDTRFVASEWYSVDGIDEMIELVAGHLDVDPVEYALRLGRGVTSEGAGRIGRTALGLFGTPKRIATYLPRYWGQLYDSGDVRCAFDPSTGKLDVRVRNWHGHTPLGCFNPLGSLSFVSEQLGKPRFLGSERLACVSEGAPACHYEFRFA